MAVRITLVEDNPADVYLLEEALRTHGVVFELDWIPDGEQALARLSAMRDGAQPHLILLDLNLPKVDGKELLSAVRKTPALRGTRVAILTSSDSPSDRRDTEALGADCYIKKPPTLDEFLAIGRVIKELVSGVAL
jgi:two-component system, chemotaxis family, response regulator Rcp1